MGVGDGQFLIVGHGMPGRICTLYTTETIHKAADLCVRNMFCFAGLAYARVSRVNT